MPTNGAPLEILLVEDNPAHAELVIRSFKDHQIANKITHLVDGELALDYLLQQGPYKDNKHYTQPDLILLDLRLPKIDGLEVLDVVKTSDTLKSIPVVILTTSAADMDMAKAYNRHANSYLVKPIEFSSFTKMMTDLGYYWLVWNQKPYEG